MSGPLQLGLWGPDDQIGALSDVTADHVAEAARLATHGVVFPLNWNLQLPEPALFQRGPMIHTVTDGGYGLDDRYDGFWPQRSSQWDALSHFRNPHHGFYGGRQANELKGRHAKNGIDSWARRGIAGRFVLADIGRWRAAAGRPLDPGNGEAVPLSELIAILDAQEVSLRLGDFLLLRFGWVDWYHRLGSVDRAALALPDSRWTASGLDPSESTIQWLWDAGATAVIADNPAVEAFPFDPEGASLHTNLLPLLGMPLGELWYLDDLATYCATTRRYTGLLTAAPLNLPGGTGSPANALASCDH